MAIKHDGELINADSRQIYKYLDIGTNKGTVVEQGDHYAIQYKNKLIPIHLLSFVNPDQPYNAWQFAKDAEKLILEILDRKKLPIIVGGSGLYLQALIQGIAGSSTKRSELNVLSIDELKKLIPPSELEKLNHSDSHNPRRLVRIIEKLKDAKESPEQKAGGAFDFQIIYIKARIDEIEEKLKQRVKQMWQLGLVDEYKKITQELKFSPDSISLQGMGYQQVANYLARHLDESEVVNDIYLAHRQYAKRQLTWFQKYLQPEYLGSSTLQQVSLNQSRLLMK